MPAQNDVRVTIRVDKDLKEQADILFDSLGLNMTTALNVFLRKAVAEDAIPFSLSTKKSGIVSDATTKETPKVPKSEFENDSSVSEATKAFETAVQDEVRTQKKSGFPVARYDVKEKRAYLEYTDGKREYVSK